jgi:hypothetical protein
MWGGDPSGFFAEAGLRPRVVEAGADRWRVQTRERYAHVPASLVTAHHLAGPAVRRPQFDLLTTAARNPMLTDSGGGLTSELARRREQAQRTGDPLHAVVLWQLQTMDAPPSEIAATAQTVHHELVAMRVQGDPDRAVFANAGVHLIRRAPEVVHRAKLASFWLRIAHDARLGRGEIEHLHAANAADDHVFASSQHLYDGIFLLDAYLGPLLGALTPAIWGFSAHRTFGVVVYSLGQPLTGTNGEPAALLEVLPTQSAADASPVPTLTAPASSDALDWWTSRLNAMFAVLTDPAVFTDGSDTYRPEKHLHALLTVEQLFRQVSSIQTCHRDTNARRVLLFTALDTLERLTARDLGKLCSLRIARKTLDDLRGTLPAGAAEVLLPAAERAVRALETLQDGFFLRRQLGTADIELPEAGGGTRRWSPDAAAAEYLKVLRNSTHGYGSNRARRVELTNALLAHHDGAIPHDLGLLGYLYLLDVLTHPEVLAKHLYGGGRT